MRINPIIFTIAVMIMFILFAGLFWEACAQPVICPDNLWKGLIAEAVSDGHEGMEAVACCVRNRLDSGMSPGLVALKRKDLDKFVYRQGVDYEFMAKAIVMEVFYHNTPDVTKGATHYEAIQRYGKPKWVKGMQKTVKIGEHTFYKTR